MNVEDIKAQYPDAGPADPRAHGGPYCVGGALCQYLGKSGVFKWPTVWELAFTLQEANPNLDDSKARQYAARIMDLNDMAEDIPAAWDMLGKALNDEG